MHVKNNTHYLSSIPPEEIFNSLYGQSYFVTVTQHKILSGVIDNCAKKTFCFCLIISRLLLFMQLCAKSLIINISSTKYLLMIRKKQYTTKEQ